MTVPAPFRTLTAIAIALSASLSAQAASMDAAQDYHDRLMEVTDISMLSDETAEIIIDQFATMGMSFSGENREKAIALTSETYAEVFPEIFNAQIPLLAELYTDEELEYMRAQLDDPMGASIANKGGVLGARTAVISQEIAMPAILPLMPKLQELMDK